MAPRLATANVPVTPAAHPPRGLSDLSSTGLPSWVVMGHPPFPSLATLMASSYISAGMKSPRKRSLELSKSLRHSSTTSGGGVMTFRPWDFMASMASSSHWRREAWTFSPGSLGDPEKFGPKLLRDSLPRSSVNQSRARERGPADIDQIIQAGEPVVHVDDQRGRVDGIHQARLEADGDIGDVQPGSWPETRLPPEGGQGVLPPLHEGVTPNGVRGGVRVRREEPHPTHIHPVKEYVPLLQEDLLQVGSDRRPDAVKVRLGLNGQGESQEPPRPVRGSGARR